MAHAYRDGQRPRRGRHPAAAHAHGVTFPQDMRLVKLRRITQEYGLNSHQGEALTILGIRLWLLQGQQLVREGKLTADVFFKIATYHTHLSEHEVQIVFNAVNRKLFEGVDEKIGKSFFSFFESSKKIEHEKHVNLERYQQRRIMK